MNTLRVAEFLAYGLYLSCGVWDSSFQELVDAHASQLGVDPKVFRSLVQEFYVARENVEQKIFS